MYAAVYFATRTSDVRSSSTAVRVDTHKHEHRLDEDEMKRRHWFTSTGLTNGRRSKRHATLPTFASTSKLPFSIELSLLVLASTMSCGSPPSYSCQKLFMGTWACGEGPTHKHEHRLDEDEIKPRHWFTRTWLTNGRYAKLHTTLPSIS
jgi:hypothetical protein